MKKRIEFYLSLFAVLISLLAVSISHWQLEVTREHNRLSVKPKISITPYLEGVGGRNGVYIENSGLGPGTIIEFQVHTPNGIFSGLGEDKWSHVFAKNNIESFCFAKSWPDPGSTLKSGDKVALLEISKAAPDGCYLKSLELLQRDDIAVKVKYQSLYEEEFSTERKMLVNSKELDIINSIINKYVK